MDPRLAKQIEQWKLPMFSLPQEGINSFLNEALKKANAFGSFSAFSGGIDRHLASLTKAADFNARLLRSFEPPTSAIQRIIDEAARTAAIYRRVESLTDMLTQKVASMRTLADFHQEMLRSFQPPKTSIQLIIDAAQKAALQFDSHHLGRNYEQRLLSLQMLGGTSQVFQQAISANQLWQSRSISEFASRILRETEFRNALIKRLESEPVPETPPDTGSVSIETALNTIEQGLADSGVLQGSHNSELAVAQMFSWWSKQPTDVRSLTIALLVAIMSLVIEYGVFAKEQTDSELPLTQRVKIVQKITNNIFLNGGITGKERSQFRIVTKDRLPVFQSNRRDSARVATLRAAQIVFVKSKKRNWTQVEWKDLESDMMFTGWVFTRYLKKI